jgi:hypothetical protein
MDLVAMSIDGLLGGGAVVTEPVGLHDESQGRPEEVDLESVQDHGGLRELEADTPNDSEEGALELRVREAKGSTIQDAAKARDTGDCG